MYPHRGNHSSAPPLLCQLEANALLLLATADPRRELTSAVLGSAAMLVQSATESVPLKNEAELHTHE